MTITRTAMIDDDGSGTTGTILNNAWKQELYNQIDGLVGPWVNVPFNAGNFTTNGVGVWTVTAGQQELFRYTKIGPTVIVSLTIVASTISIAAPPRIYVTLPLEIRPATPKHGSPLAYLSSGDGVAGAGLCLTTPTQLDLLRDVIATPWQLGGTYIYLTAIYSL